MSAGVRSVTRSTAASGTNAVTHGCGESCAGGPLDHLTRCDAVHELDVGELRLGRACAVVVQVRGLPVADGLDHERPPAVVGGRGLALEVGEAAVADQAPLVVEITGEAPMVQQPVADPLRRRDESDLGAGDDPDLTVACPHGVEQLPITIRGAPPQPAAWRRDLQSGDLVDHALIRGSHPTISSVRCTPATLPAPGRGGETTSRAG